ncbi:MAG: IS1182 family transposase [Chlorobiaceae bacterium]
MHSDFLSADRDTLYLLPPSVQDWLPVNHLARFVVDIVAQLDLTPLRDAYAGRGCKAYDPEMLLSLLFYGYATGTFSSRKLELATYESIAVRYITGNSHPDHDTIANFRKRFLAELKPFFIQILTLAHEMNILKIGKISIDGTKIKANASKHQALSWGHACKLEKQLKEEVDSLLRQAEQADQSAIPDGMSIPEELERREKRLEAIARAKLEIERRADERYAKEQAEHEAKLAERERKSQKSGKKPGGKPPKAPESGVKDRDQVNLTDEESRIMPVSGGGFMQAYNAQASVDLDTMLMVAVHVTQHTNDKLELQPAFDELNKLPERLGKVTEATADAGYFSETNVGLCEREKITPYIAAGRESHNQSLADRFSEPEPIAEDADAVTKMKHRLKTKDGKAVYAKRKCTVEPVFGVIKSVLGFRQFLLRGIENVRGEWDLVSIAWNLKRLNVLRQIIA